MANSVETHLIRLAGQEVPYLLKRSRRRSVGLRVDATGLTVQAPLRASHKWLEQVLHEKARWVQDKLAQMQATTLPAPLWQDGEAVPFLGETLRLTLLQGSSQPPFLCDGELILGVPATLPTSHVEKQVVGWYRNQALACFRERASYYAVHLGLAFSSLKLSNAATRWGSCNARGQLRLNWRLIKAPLPLIDYVVAHELAHLRHLDHSPAFWRVVESLYPDYASARTALRESGALYHAF